MHRLTNVIDAVVKWVLGAPSQKENEELGRLAPARVPALSPRRRAQLERRGPRPLALGRPARRSHRLLQ